MTSQTWTRVVIGALAALLLASLVANVALVRTAFSYFAEANQIRLDPVGLSFYAKDRTAPPPPGPLLVFFGDSRANMWGKPEVPGFTVINRGIGWQTTAQILARVDVDVTPLHPKVVVFEGGVNDLKTVAEFPERRAQIISDCEANIARIVDACRKAGATVALNSVFEIGHVPLVKRPFWSDDVAVAVREVNAFLPTLAGDHVLLFDANRVLDDGHGEVQRPFQLDYLHLKPNGYEALDQKLFPLLSSAPR